MIPSPTGLSEETAALLKLLNTMFDERLARLEIQATFWQTEFDALMAGACPDHTKTTWAELDAINEMRRAADYSIEEHKNMHELLLHVFHMKKGK